MVVLEDDIVAVVPDEVLRHVSELLATAYIEISEFRS